MVRAKMHFALCSTEETCSSPTNQQLGRVLRVVSCAIAIANVHVCAMLVHAMPLTRGGDSSEGASLVSHHPGGTVYRPCRPSPGDRFVARKMGGAGGGDRKLALYLPVAH